MLARESQGCYGKATSINGTEIDLFDTRKHHETLIMKRVKTTQYNSLLIYVLLATSKVSDLATK
jgi:hypothetical protein